MGKQFKEIMPRAQCYKYCVVILDLFSRWSEALPTTNNKENLHILISDSNSLCTPPTGIWDGGKSQWGLQNKITQEVNPFSDKQLCYKKLGTNCQVISSLS